MRKVRYPLVLLATLFFIALPLSACSSSTPSSPNSSTIPTPALTALPTATLPTTLKTPGNFTCVAGNIIADGSSAIQPLVQQVAQSYQNQCNVATITVKPSGSSRGLTELAVSSIQIGDSDIVAPTNLRSLFVDHAIAIGIFTVVINNQVTGVTSLTSTQLRDIYSGQITNWQQVGGPKLAIHVFCRIPGSGTRQTFDTYVLAGTTPTCEQVIDTSDVLAKYLQNTPGAIGYDILSVAQKAQLNILRIDDQTPNLSAIRSGKYAFWNVEHMYSQQNPPELAQALLDYMYSPTAKTIITSLGFLNTDQVPTNIVKAHLAQES